MARTNSTVADQVAADMLGIMDSDEHKEIFGQTVALKKSASLEDENAAAAAPPVDENAVAAPPVDQNAAAAPEDENDAKGKPPWLEKGEEKEEKGEKEEEKEEKEEKGEKEEKEDEDDAKSCGAPWMKSKATLSVAIQGLAKISEALDEVGLESSASATLNALETLVTDAAKVAEAEALGIDPKDLDPEIAAELVGEKSPKA